MPRFLLMPGESEEGMEGRVLRRDSWTAGQPETLARDEGVGSWIGVGAAQE